MMGTILSALATTFKGIKALLQDLSALLATYNDLNTRLRASPGLPVPNPTSAYWQDDPPFPNLVNTKSPTLPTQADIVIIGSGIAAAAIARSVLHECARHSPTSSSSSDSKSSTIANNTTAITPGLPRIVVCEARTLTSGATGRNGGHIKACPHADFARFRRRFGVARAAELVRFQLRHLPVLVGLCRDEGIDVAECREVETVDLFLDERVAREAEEAMREVGEAVPEWKYEFLGEGSEVRRRFSVNNLVVAAATYKAGALWPYRLITSVWKSLLDKFPHYLTIETNTPVTAITPSPSTSTYPYTVTTPRGSILAKHIIHATNAHASHLIPGLRGKMTSALAHMTAQQPGPRFPDLNGSRSWSPIYSAGGSTTEGGFDYVSQRPTGADGTLGHVLCGGGFRCSPGKGLDVTGCCDDSRLDVLTTAHNLGIMPALFGRNWGGWDASKGQQEIRSAVWSGVIAFAADLMPLVGRLDERITGRSLGFNARGRQKSAVGSEKTGWGRWSVPPGEWIAAAFVGDGMVWAWLCGTALGVMLAGTETDYGEATRMAGRPEGRLDEWFPKELLATYERIKKMDIADLAEL